MEHGWSRNRALDPCQKTPIQNQPDTAFFPLLSLALGGTGEFLHCLLRLNGLIPLYRRGKTMGLGYLNLAYLYGCSNCHKDKPSNYTRIYPLLASVANPPGAPPHRIPLRGSPPPSLSNQMYFFSVLHTQFLC